MQARGISILCDKATDITMNKIFCVNVRFLPSGSTEPVTKLYCLLPVENGKADGLFEFLKAAPKTRLLVTHQTTRTSRKEKTIPFWRECKMRPAQTFSFWNASTTLVAEHACEFLSKYAEQLVHDIYNYFKNSHCLSFRLTVSKWKCSYLLALKSVMLLASILLIINDRLNLANPAL